LKPHFLLLPSSLMLLLPHRWHRSSMSMKWSVFIVTRGNAGGDRGDDEKADNALGERFLVEDKSAQDAVIELDRE